MVVDASENTDVLPPTIDPHNARTMRRETDARPRRLIALPSYEVDEELLQNATHRCDILAEQTLQFF